MKLKTFLSFFIFPLCSAHAADFTPFINEGGGVNIAITGEIESGDGLVLGTIAKEIRDLSLPIDYIALDSNGGVLEDAINLSYVVRSIHAKTFVSEGARCRNECLIIFSAGDQRVLAPRARVATKGYDFSLELTGEDKTLFDPQKLLSFYDVPTETIARILKPLSRKVYTFTSKDKQVFATSQDLTPANLNIFTPFDNEAKSGYEHYLNGLAFFAGISVVKDMNIALYHFNKAADRGIPEAFHRIGVLYFKGLIQPGADKAMAESYWEKSAKVGYYPSMMNLAIAFENSNDIETAEVNKKILSDEKTSDLIRSFAAYSLGNFYLYDSGRMTSGAQVNAINYYRKGAYLGNSDAQYEYASMLNRNGKRQEAYYWFKLACSVEQEDSCRYLRKDR